MLAAKRAGEDSRPMHHGLKSGVVRRRFVAALAAGVWAPALVLSINDPAGAQEAKKNLFPGMAPAEQYRMTNRSEEIALARSAAPPSISSDAEVLVLGEREYETAVKGKNGFVCLVERSWSDAFDDVEFWNAKNRSPICLNAAAASSVLPIDLEKTRWALAGVSKDEMISRTKSSAAAGQAPAPGSMAYMMSKQGHLSDSVGHWHPHVMLFQRHMALTDWGANLPGSPVLGQEGGTNEATVFYVPVSKWSDGTSAAMNAH